jgi:SAM-dependent methyltransferase
MTLSNANLDRGRLGNVPALTTRADEAFLDFMCEARNQVLHAHYRPISQLADRALADAGLKPEHNRENVARVRDVIAQSPDLAAFLRVKRSAQERYKQRIIESYGARAEDLKRWLDEAATRGPGSVTVDPDFVYPDYATVEIHIQPWGYTGHPLAGFFYDYGTSIFFGGANAGDALHAGLVARVSLPKDGRVKRTLDLACSVGQFASEMKKRFPDAETIGIDISAPMVRYAHWRAVQQNLDVHFAQMPAEDLAFPDNHFDVVTSYLLFHEIPLPVIKKVLQEVRRVLRPGGTFTMFDFPSARPEDPGYGGLVGLMDASDNGEPYAHSFVTCGIERLIGEAGFSLRYTAPADIAKHGRVCDKLK